MRNLSLGVALLGFAGLCAAPASALQLLEVGKVADGRQFDVATDGTSRIYVLSSRVTVLDPDGALLTTYDIGDGRMESLAFSPDLKVDGQGDLHLVTRHDPPAFSTGHEIRYRKLSPTGQLLLDRVITTPIPRNYVVGVVALDNGGVYAAHSRQTSDVNALVDFYQLTSSTVVPLGPWASDKWLRVDCDYRMVSAGDQIYVASGSPWSPGTVSFFMAPGGNTLPQALSSSRHVHQAGSGRRGFPDLYAASDASVHLTYGTQSSVFYNRYAANAAVFAADRELFADTGQWHLSVGLSAVAASGMNVAVAALRSDGSKTAANSALVVRFSADGGQSWDAEQATGRTTDAGEGRNRPRLIVLGSSFYLFYYDVVASGVALIKASFGPPTDPVDAGASVDDASAGDGSRDAGSDMGRNSGGDSAPGQTDAGAIAVDSGAARETLEAGCSCSAASASTSSAAPWAAALGALAFIGATRYKRRRRPSRRSRALARRRCPGTCR